MCGRLKGARFFVGKERCGRLLLGIVIEEWADWITDGCVKFGINRKKFVLETPEKQCKIPLTREKRQCKAVLIEKNSLILYNAGKGGHLYGTWKSDQRIPDCFEINTG